MLNDRSLIRSALISCVSVIGAIGAWSNPALASPPATGLQAPDFRVDQHLTSKGLLEIEALPPAGHHFNVQAPMYFEWTGPGASSPARIQPLEKSRASVRFRVSPQNSPRNYKISAYLCDDKNTYCERHAVEQIAPASVAAKQGNGEPQVASGSAGAAKNEAPAHEHVSGFILNDPRSAFRQARDTHRLVMIDFFAIWCPPCNELDEHVFSAPEFQKQTSDFVRLKLDVDSRISWRWKAKYAIQGYPTIIFATPEGDEVGRIVGFRPLPTFLADAHQSLANRDASFAKLRARADSGDTVAAAQLGLMEFDRARWENARKYLQLSGQTEKYGEQISEAQIGILEDQLSASAKSDPALTTQLIAELEKSVHDYPNTPDSIDRQMRLADLYGEQKNDVARKKALTDAVATAQYLMKHPDLLKNKDCTAGDLWEDIGDAYDQAGEAARAKDAYQSGVNEYRSLMKTDSERGYSLELAYCLWKSGEVSTANALYQKFENLYPDEFTFYFYHAWMEHSLGKNPQALALARTAFERSYGDNKLRCGKLVADILESQGLKAEARAQAKKTLEEVRLPKNSSLRAHRYAGKLQEMIKRLQPS